MTASEGQDDVNAETGSRQAPAPLHALQMMSRPAPAAPPAGYVGWPLWYHRVCLVHNRVFGWLYILGIAIGAIFPHVWIG